VRLPLVPAGVVAVAEVKIAGGVTFQTATPDEVRGIFREEMKEQARETERARAVKAMRRSVQLTTPAGTRLTQLDSVTPAAGYIWSVRLIGVWLAAAGTGQSFITSDTVSTLSTQAQRQPVATFTTSAQWQVAYPPKGACTLSVDEGLYLNFTQNITGYILAGWEVPGEMAYKLL
jgi:hypothetical protein